MQRYPEMWRIVGQTGQALQLLADPVAPHSLINKLGGMVGDRNRLRNPGLQLGEIKPQTSD